MVAKKKTNESTNPVPKKKSIVEKKTDQVKGKTKAEPQKINFDDHDFSFNLLTEPWLPVISLKGEKKLLSLNDFLKQAQDLERFDFPLPGLETAVLRFLVAIVHIVGAPKDKSEWEDWYKQGKFENGFITELQTYKNKLDLFSKTEPFLQEVEIFENTIKPVSKLIDSFPSGNNSSHFGIVDLKKDIDSLFLHPSIALPVMLYCYIGVLAGTDGDGGLNGGATPYYVSLHSNNLYKTILLNVLDAEKINNDLASKKKCRKAQAGWLDDIKDDLPISDLSIQNALLWKPRRVRLIPSKVKNQICVISGLPIANFGIKEISYTKQKASILKSEFWEDSFNGIIEIPVNKTKTDLKKSKPFGDFPSWKDFPNLILLEKKQDEEKFVSPPLLVRRFLTLPVKKDKNTFISLLGVVTNKAKILRISENKFPFRPSFVEDESIASNIKTIVQDTKKFENKIYFSLIIAFKLEKKVKTKQGRKIREKVLSLFQSAYWHELGTAFEDSLAQLAESDKYADEVLKDWEVMLAEHVRSTFLRHTEKLIHNPKNLKAYENGRRYLEISIHTQLLKEKQ
jgi:CRISPR type I-E-associated protein CasA/Cse1